MKKLFTLSLLLTLALCGLSCSSSPEVLPSGSHLAAQPATLNFGTTGGEQLLSVTTDAGSWTLVAIPEDDWCIPSKLSGTTSSSFKVTVSPNDGITRNTTLTLRAPNCTDVAITVTQEGLNGEVITGNPKQWDGVKRGALTYQMLIYGYADADGDKLGDLRGLTAKLDHIDALGASAVWLSPIHPAKSYHGYDVLDYEALNTAYGTEADFSAFVAKAHEKGIKVYLDYVLNHTGKGHKWFTEACKSEQNPYRDYYLFSKTPQADIAAGIIPMIATEGGAGYEANQWYTAATGMAAPVRYKFTLDWSNASAPTITVESATSVDADNTTPAAGDKFLYFGDATVKRLYPQGNGIYTLSLDFASSWGFLVRTSDTSWNAGEKWGAQSPNTVLTIGTPFRLYSNASSDPANVELTASYKYHSHFWTEWFADLNFGAVATCETSPAFVAITTAAKKWIDLGVDGFRLDAVKHIYHNAYSDENPKFLKKFYDQMNTYYRSKGHSEDIYVVGEMLDSYDRVAPYYAGIPALFEFSFWYKLKWALQNDTGSYFAKDILEYQSSYAAFRPDYIEATKLSNHDEDRTGSDLDKSLPKLKLAAAVLLTAQGEPYVYMGEELGYWGTKTQGDEYVRSPIVWDKDKTDMYAAYTEKLDNAMLTGAISVETQTADAQSLLNVYRRFGALRNIYPAMGKGKMTPHGVYNASNADYKQIAAWYREYQGEKMLVVHNFSDKTVTLSLSDDVTNDAAVSGVVSLAKSDGGCKVSLGAYSSAVFEL